MKWIDDIILGLIDSVGSNDIYDIISHLGIEVVSLNHDSILLKVNDAIYHRHGDKETIFISDKLINRTFVLAHEVGHDLLHIEESVFYFNPLLNKGKLEKEANYFATKLLYKDIYIEDGIETYEQLANSLVVNEDVVEYLTIINKF